MATVSCSTVLPAPLDEVWEVLGDFGTWPAFIPRITDSVLEGGQGRGPVGAVRVLTLSDGSTVRERLLRYDDTAHLLAYEFDGPVPFPVRSYVGGVQLWPVTMGEGGTFAYWTGTFDCDESAHEEVSEIFVRTYRTFLTNLADHLERSVS
jgi:Polyketide cyclase / dehydrase and lipid transport